jgi:hypothetical protein
MNMATLLAERPVRPCCSRRSGFVAPIFESYRGIGAHRNGGARWRGGRAILWNIKSGRFGKDRKTTLVECLQSTHTDHENHAKWCTNQLAAPRMRKIDHLCTKRQERTFKTKASSPSKSTQSYALTGETIAVEASNQSGFSFSICSGMVH